MPSGGLSYEAAYVMTFYIHSCYAVEDRRDPIPQGLGFQRNVGLPRFLTSWIDDWRLMSFLLVLYLFCGLRDTAVGVALRDSCEALRVRIHTWAPNHFPSLSC